MEVSVFSFIWFYFCIVKAHYWLIYIKVSHNSKHFRWCETCLRQCLQDTERLYTKFPSKDEEEFYRKISIFIILFSLCFLFFSWMGIEEILTKNISEWKFPWNKIIVLFIEVFTAFYFFSFLFLYSFCAYRCQIWIIVGGCLLSRKARLVVMFVLISW